MTPQSTGQRDVRSYLRILWRWKFLFLAFLVLIPLAAYLVERGKPEVYQSSTLILPLNSSVGTGSSAPVLDLLAVARLVTTTAVAQSAAVRLHPPASPGFLLGEASAAPDVDTGFITITAQDRDPHRAAEIANAFAAALSNRQSAQAINGIDAQIGALRKQLAALPRSDAAARDPLSQQITTLKALRSSTGAGAQVIQPAVASTTPVGSTTRRAVEIAFVIAVLLGLGAVLAAENSDRRLRRPEDLEDLTSMPLLGTIAPSAFAPDGPDSPRDGEAFKMLSGALTYFNSDRPLASVAIISPGPAEGKTTVAVGLAIAAARAGGRAILVDADLRRPQVCTRLGIEATAGLGAVLARERGLSEVLVEHQVDAPEGGRRGRLLVLPAGLPNPDPSALLRSPEMRTLLRQLEARADLVIIDTPAALVVSDALPLLAVVSGIVMIVRMNQSPKAAARRLQTVIASAGGTVLGVVATASASVTGEYGGAYGYYGEAQNGHGTRWLGLRRHRSAAPRPQTPPDGAAAPESQLQRPLAGRPAQRGRPAQPYPRSSRSRSPGDNER